MNHRKRTGQHHRKHAKPYAKAYWPYLPLLAVIGLGFVLNILWPQPGSSVLAYATNMSPAALLQETNAQRSSAGQTILNTNQLLTSAAQAKANDMAARDYWSHVTPDGKEPWWFVTNAGYDYLTTGENLAYGFDSSLAAITGWMNSPGHRANLLSANYQDVGFGIANVDNYQGQGPETIVVALYGKLAGQAAVAGAVAPAAKPATTAKPQPAGTTATTANSPSQAAPAPTPATTTPTPVASNTAVMPATLQPNTQVADANRQPVATLGSSQRVARLQLLSTDVSQLSLLVVILAAATAMAIFILRHMYFWHRTLVKGERFFVKHWKLDLVIIAMVVVGALLTRTAGFIQ